MSELNLTGEQVPTVSVTIKVCPRCKQNKNLEEFGPNRGHKSGRQAYCRGCMRIVCKESIARAKAKRGEMKI